MSSAPKACLRMRAKWLGPVGSLDADLSKHAQKLVYARNGTGKSFPTRALRYLDLHGDGEDIQDALINLLAEESTDGDGFFELSQGGVNIGKLTLSSTMSLVTPDISDRIFHVFSENFVHAELRQSNFVVNDDIESKISLDQSIINTKDAKEARARAESLVKEIRERVDQRTLQLKDQQLASKAGVNKRLRGYGDIELGMLLKRHTTLPEQTARSYGDVLSDFAKKLKIHVFPSPKVILPSSSTRSSGKLLISPLVLDQALDGLR